MKSRLLSLILILSILAGFTVPAVAASPPEDMAQVETEEGPAASLPADDSDPAPSGEAGEAGPGPTGNPEDAPADAPESVPQTDTAAQSSAEETPSGQAGIPQGATVSSSGEDYVAFTYFPGEVSEYGYADPGYRARSIAGTPGEVVQPAADELPRAYSSVAESLITPVKNQGAYGVCWGFAAQNALEANMVKNGAASNTSIDLSELHFAYFMYNRRPDPLGNTTGDRNVISGSEDFLDVGGNGIYSAFALSGWMGSAPETVAPYGSAASARKNGLAASLAYAQNSVHLTDAYFVSQQDEGSIKQLIMELGAGTMSYCSDDRYYTAGSGYLAYHSNLNTYPNHDVSVVGWDDDFSRDKFGSPKPAGNGAWLIKNSWGTGGSGGGYFWLSYEEPSLQDTSVYFYKAVPADTYENNYHYDGSVYPGGFRFYSQSIYSANVYTAAGNELVEAVGFYTGQPGVTAQVSVYTGIDDASPISGTLAAQSDPVLQPYEGFHTIELPSPAALAEGEKFSVVVKLTAAPDDYAYCLIERSADLGWLQSVSTSAAGRGFTSSNGANWQDVTTMLNDSTVSLRVKAFTNTDVHTGAPANLSARLKTDGTEVDVTWTAVSEADGYELERTVDSGDPTTQTLTTTSHKDTVAPGHTYRYRVRAYLNAGGEKVYSAYTAPVTKTVPLAPAAPGKPSVEAVISGMRVSWDAVEGATGYEVTREVGGSGGFTRLGEATGTEYTDATATTTTRYRYQVRAIATVDDYSARGAQPSPASDSILVPPGRA